MTTKKLGGLFGALAAIAASLVAARGGHHPAPKPTPEPSAATVQMWTDTCAAVMREHRQREIGPEELTGCVAVARAGGQVEQLRAWVDALPADPEPPKPPVPELVPLTTDGHIFRAAGVPWRYEGVSAFGQLDRFARGEDIDGFLDDFAGYNVLRVWPYVTWRSKNGTLIGWEPPPAETVVRFLEHVKAKGFRVELTLLTDDDPARIAWAKGLIAALAAARPTNLLLEAGNEPRTNNKSIDTAALRHDLEASGFPYSSGDYEDSTRFYGSYLTAHTGRDSEWPRRAHDMLEFYTGGGPNAPSDPAHRVPGVCDEPIRPDQATGERVKDFLAYYATCALLGAGGTFHFESGKYSHHKTIGPENAQQILPADGRPTDEEKQFAAVVLQALNAFPADAPNSGGYTRPVEQSLRTYIVGPYMVRVRPLTETPADSGWRSLAPGAVLWAR